MKIELQRKYPHPPSVVWRALTDARAIEQWWLETDFEPRVGHRFYFQDTPQGGWDGRVVGEVLEVEPERRVRFSWEGDGHRTEVSYELTPTADGGTELVLRHTGFEGVRGLLLRTMLRFGWSRLVRKLLPTWTDHIAERGIDAPFPTPPKRDRIAAA